MELLSPHAWFLTGPSECIVSLSLGVVRYGSMQDWKRKETFYHAHMWSWKDCIWLGIPMKVDYKDRATRNLAHNGGWSNQTRVCIITFSGHISVFVPSDWFGLRCIAQYRMTWESMETFIWMKLDICAVLQAATWSPCRKVNRDYCIKNILAIDSNPISSV